MRLESDDQISELLVALSTGSKEAFEKVFCHFHRGLVDYAFTIISGKTNHDGIAKKDAEDIVMDVFYKLYDSCQKKKVSFQSVPNLQAYLRVAVKNRCFDYWKVENKQSQLKAVLKTLPESREAFDFGLLDSKIFELIFTEINNLPPQARKIFLLRTFRDYDNNDIATLMDLSVKTVRNQFNNAVTRLRTSPLKGLLNNDIISLLVFFLPLFLQ